MANEFDGSEAHKMVRDMFEPLKNISGGQIDSPIYILLDGLDEQLPQNQDAVLSVIRFLLSDNEIHERWVVEKIVLSTRLHLKDLIESEFNVQAYSLVPLTQEEQVRFIEKRTGRCDALEALTSLPDSMKELISNPLMLSSFCSEFHLSRKTNSLDLYVMYTKFMVNKHELYVFEFGGSFVPFRVLKHVLNRNIPYYNYVAIREILGEDKLSKIVELAEEAEKGELIQKVSSPVKESELISYGVVVKVGQEWIFAHRSFTEFFYVRLMTDIENTPKDLRNALFALGYQWGTNLAKFVSCVIREDAEAVPFVSKGWIKFIPADATLARYAGEATLHDHLLNNTIEYEEECPLRDQLLIRDLNADKLFIRWIDKQQVEVVRNILLHANMSEILTALSHLSFQDEDTLEFMERWFLMENANGLEYEPKVSSSVKSVLSKLEWLEGSKGCTSSLVNFTKWKCFGRYASTFLNSIVNNKPDLWKHFIVLIDKNNEPGLDKIVKWMEENRDWVRQLLLNCKITQNLNAHRLIILTKVKYRSDLFSCGDLQDALSFYEDSYTSQTAQPEVQDTPKSEVPHIMFKLDKSLNTYPAHWKSNIGQESYCPFQQLIASSIPGKLYIREAAQTNQDRKYFNRSFPSIEEFAVCAEDAYVQFTYDENDQHSLWRRLFRLIKKILISILNFFWMCLVPPWPVSNKLPLLRGLPKEFQLLLAAKNNSWNNGYYGAAYVNHSKKQIILAHEGTRGIFTRGWITNIFSIQFKWMTPRVRSAITFANEVSQYAQENDYDLFFTGHSLGGWLAHVTCFSSIYLKSEMRPETDYSCRQVKKIRPLTISFDSPGSREFVNKLCSEYFIHDDRQRINIEELPCENYLFYPNLVNMHNYKIGSLYLLDLGLSWYQKWLFGGYFSHRISRAVDVISDKGDQAIQERLVDFRATTLGVVFNRVRNLLDTNSIIRDEENVCPWNKSFFLKAFFNEDELEFLKQDYSPETFEGTTLEHEEEANEMLGMKLKYDGEVTAHCEWKRRLEFIPMVRRTVQRMNSGLLWMNKDKPALPDHYITRVISNHQNQDAKNIEKKHFLAKRLQYVNFVFLVGDPGMGKSSEVTKLEQVLRSNIINVPRVIVRINLNSVQKKLASFDSGQLKSFEFVLNNLISDYTTSLVRSEITSGQHPLYLLLDGLDEVCPTHEEKLVSILQALLLNQSERDKKYASVKVVLTARPHLQNRIESEFNVKAVSMAPLTRDKQVQFLIDSRCFSSQEQADRSISDLPDPSLMENPLMLYMYSLVLRNQDSERRTELDMVSLYDSFIRAKNEEEIKKSGASMDEVSSQIRLKCQKENTCYYSFIALAENFGVDSKEFTIITELDKELAQKRSNVELQFKKPNEQKREELLKYGIVVADKSGMLRFKHRSFGEFFIASAMMGLTDKEKKREQSRYISFDTPPKMRNALFALAYENEKNISKFVAAACPENTFITKGWVDYVVNYSNNYGIERYMGPNEKFINGLLETAIDYETDNNLHKLLFSDGGSIFCKWLKSIEDAKANVFHMENGSVTSNMHAVLVKLLFFTKVNVSGILTDEEIRNSITNYSTWDKKEAQKWVDEILEDSESSVQDIQRRLGSWIEDSNTVKVILRVVTKKERFWIKCIDCKEFAKWIRTIYDSTELRTFITSEERVSDVICSNINEVSKYFGEDILPHNLLKLRCKLGIFKRRSMFQFKVPDDLIIGRVWKEIQENPENAIDVLRDDKNFQLLVQLERSIAVAGTNEQAFRNLLELIGKNGIWEVAARRWRNVGPMIISYAMLGSNWDKVISKIRLSKQNTDESFMALRSLIFSARSQSEKTQGQFYSWSDTPFETVKSWIGRSKFSKDTRFLWNILSQADEQELRLLREKYHWQGPACILNRSDLLSICVDLIKAKVKEMSENKARDFLINNDVFKCVLEQVEFVGSEYDSELNAAEDALLEVIELYLELLSNKVNPFNWIEESKLSETAADTLLKVAKRIAEKKRSGISKNLDRKFLNVVNSLYNKMISSKQIDPSLD